VSDVRWRQEATAWLLEELPRLTPAWLGEQRWFGGKTRTVEAVDVDDAFWLSPAEVKTALVVLAVRQHGALGRRVDRYALMAGFGGPGAGARPIGRMGAEAVGDVSTQESALRALLAGLAAADAIPGVRRGTVTFADTTPRARQLLAAGAASPPAIVAIGREQSNTSARVGSSHVFKLFRRLEQGHHPEIEIGRFLARIGFHGAPPLEGSIAFVPHDGEACALGALEGWVESVDDGWGDLVGGLGGIQEPGRARDLADRLSSLGATTADFHLAMASDPESGTFAPEPVTDADRNQWRQALVEQGERAVALVGRQVDQWTGTAGQLARRVVANRSAIAGRLRQIAQAGLAGDCHKIRIHGDYHLGQTLRTRDGYVLIDFEGEPSRPLAERRRKHSALKDVAGMLRSFEYAVATARHGLPADAAERLTADWLRDAFLDAYLARASAAGVPVLPSAPGAVEAWLGFFELEKMLYEVEYEAENRPSWVHIPLAAVVEALGGAGRGGERAF
jgi:maltose alpha-D-glucosyltransferase/alpha-amylase